MRHSAASNQTDISTHAFAEDVAYYLTQTPRQLPSRYLYDELGSSLFEAICRLPWYAITRTEQHLLETQRRGIFDRLGAVSTIVELGPGSGEKLTTLLAEYAGHDLTVHLVDVSAAALDKATRALMACRALPAVIHRATYEVGLFEAAQGARSPGRTVVVFLGSNIGNFDPPGAGAFLGGVRRALRPGDVMLLGADLVKPEAELLLAYDDPLGVTAAFNRNLLVRVNRELGGDFDVQKFAHRAIWNESASRVEMHLVSRERQRVRVPAADIEITFERDEPIWTESSYKYRPEDLETMLQPAGFGVIGQWFENGFALTLAEAV